MYRPLFLTVVLAALMIISPSLAQEPQQTPGPVVSAYLTSLAEEIRELDFQLRQKEISRSDYERTRQRLLLMRAMIESRAAETAEDRVPEFQIVTASEFSILGLSATPEAAKLKADAVFEDQWKLLRVVAPARKGGTKFYVFERLGFDQRPLEIEVDEKMSALNAQAASVPASSVLETIVMIEDAPWWLAGSNGSDKPPATAATSATAAATIPPASETGSPRFLTFYLPVYTTEAREKNIEGEIILSAVFGSNGQVRDVRQIKGLGHGLDERAIESLKKISFDPARRDRQAVDVRTRVIYRFTLSRVTVQVLPPDQTTSQRVEAKGTQP